MLKFPWFVRFLPVKDDEQKLQLNTVWRLEESGLTPCDDCRAPEEGSSSVLIITDEKPWALYLPSPSHLPFTSVKMPALLAMQGLAHGSPCLQTPNCNSLLIPNKIIFVGEMSGCLFALGQQQFTMRHMWLRSYHHSSGSLQFCLTFSSLITPERVQPCECAQSSRIPEMCAVLF